MHLVGAPKWNLQISHLSTMRVSMPRQVLQLWVIVARVLSLTQTLPHGHPPGFGAKAQDLHSIQNRQYASRSAGGRVGNAAMRLGVDEA